jgi:hypothetical protein
LTQVRPLFGNPVLHRVGAQPHSPPHTQLDSRTGPGDLIPTEPKTASDCPSREPVRHYFSKKQHCNFRNRPFQPLISIIRPFSCPEISTFCNDTKADPRAGRTPVGCFDRTRIRASFRRVIFCDPGALRVGRSREKRPLVLSYIVLRIRMPVYGVKTRLGRTVFPITILHFRVTILRSSPGRGDPGPQRARMGDAFWGRYCSSD